MLSGGFAESRKRKIDDAARGDGQYYRVAINDSTADTIGRILRFVYTCNSTEDAKSALVELRQVGQQCRSMLTMMEMR